MKELIRMIRAKANINQEQFASALGTTAVDGRNIFYHGSKKGIVGDLSPISRAECDFGQGFYMGTATLQPLTLVCAEDKPKFYMVEFDLSGLKVLEVEIGMDWAMMIAYYRKQMEKVKGTPIYEKYAHFWDSYDVSSIHELGCCRGS